jgi:hypothetical protein
VDTPSLPHIAELISYGEIKIGHLGPVGCVAIAGDEDTTFAMLVRRPRESLFQLLTRLEEAVPKPMTKRCSRTRSTRRTALSSRYIPPTA